jgi:hypothetical protein
MAFFEDLCFVGFCDEINFENPKKMPYKTPTRRQVRR